MYDEDPTFSPGSDYTLSPRGSPSLSPSSEQDSPAGVEREHRESPTTWGSFKLLARIGQGSFGEVYRAWDPGLEREVALKLLLPITAGTQQTERDYNTMLREARTLAAIQHANIVRVYGVDRHDGRVGFWTDLVKGSTLSSLVSAQGPFGCREAAIIVLDIARALSAVHRSGILHRDIKAENVMREEGGRILLMDFGLSALPNRAGVAGTPPYMAPELWQGREATVQTDIYAIGVLLYYLVSGQYPMQLRGITEGEVAAALASRRPLMDLRSDLPESFLRIVDIAMDDNPRKRFASAGQLSVALSESLGSAPPEPPASPAGRTMLGLAIGTALLILIAAAGFQSRTVRLWFHPQPSSETSAGLPAADMSDEYLKAQDLLQHAYLNINLAAAITGFQHVLDKDPTNPLAEAGLGTALFAEYSNSSDPKLLDQAKDAINKSLQLDPNLAPAFATRARMEAMAGHTDLALQLAQKAIQLGPHSAEAYGALAEVYYEQGKMNDAVDAVQKAIDLAPDNSSWLVRLGSYLLDNGKPKEAADAWQEAIRLDPRNIYALFDLGVVEMRDGQLEQARPKFEKILQIQPDGDSYQAIGNIFSLEGKYDKAEEMERKAIALDPSARSAWGNLASAYAWSGDHAKAVESYRKAIELAQEQRAKAPDNATLLAELAGYYASVGDAAHSLPLTRKALVLAPNDPHIIYLAGESYELLKQRDKAIPLLSKALAQGYQTIMFQRSPEMSSLRSDPAFQSALAKANSENAVDTTRRLR